MLFSFFAPYAALFFFATPYAALLLLCCCLIACYARRISCVRSEALLWLGAPTAWLQHIEDPQVASVLKEDQSETTSLVALFPDGKGPPWYDRMQNGRAKAMV